MRQVGIGVAASLGALLVLAAWALVLALWAQGGLTAVAAWYLGLLLVPLAGLGALAHSLIVALLLPRLRAVAVVAAGLGGLSLAPGLVLLGLWTPTYPASLDETAPAATVRLPLDGPVLVGWGGDHVGVNDHAATPDQRWAYDLLVEPAGHGSADLDAYGCYDLPVLAPAAGTVARAVDHEPDQDPSTFTPNPTAPLGNHVVLELDTGTFLVLAHLKPGSVAVQDGDTVAEGQVLGRCGNSGNTSEPHVHLHHVRQFPEVVGFGEGLPLFFRDHDGPPMPEGGVEEADDGSARFVGDVVEHQGATREVGSPRAGAYGRGGGGFGSTSADAVVLDLGPPEVDGSLSDEIVARVLKSREAQLRYCYLRRLRDTPDLAGRLVLAFTVDPGGRVTEARIVSDTLADPEVGTCVAPRIERTRFPGAGGPTRVRVALDVAPG